MVVSTTSECLRTGDQVRGKIFVFTGRLRSLSRREAAALVRIRGGLIRSQVSRRTSVLVIGDGDSGSGSGSGRRRQRSRQLQAAVRLETSGAPIRLASEAEFLGLMGLGSARRLRERYYTSRDVLRLYGFGGRELRALEDMALIRPILRTGCERYYTFSDLRLFRDIRAATGQGVPLVRAARRLLQARAGQIALRFDEDRTRILPFDGEARSSWGAEEWFGFACECDERPASLQQAASAYERVLTIDPYHVGALINLGNLRYDNGNIDDARRLYERALASDPRSAIAHYNLGNVFDDLGDYERAIRYFKTAIDLRPQSADAYFNLGLVYDRLGKVGDVRLYMRRYLQLNPEGDMADVAREYLQLTEDSLELLDPDPQQ